MKGTTDQTRPIASPVSGLSGHTDTSPAVGWVHSICLLFLVIGIFGAVVGRSIQLPPLPKDHLSMPVDLQAASAPAPVVGNSRGESEPPKATPPGPTSTKDDQIASIVSSPTPRIVALPPMGPLVTPTPFAEQVPDFDSIEPKPANPPEWITPTGPAGSRPSPPYPPSALSNHQQGTVTLLLIAGETGALMEVQIIASSGHAVLDRSTKEYLKRHWTVSPGLPGRKYQASIQYRLQEP
jgi:TonB family protein